MKYVILWICPLYVFNSSDTNAFLPWTAWPRSAASPWTWTLSSSTSSTPAARKCLAFPRAPRQFPLERERCEWVTALKALMSYTDGIVDRSIPTLIVQRQTPLCGPHQSRVGEDRRSSIGRSWRSCRMWSLCWIGDHLQKDRQSVHRSFVAYIQVDMVISYRLQTYWPFKWLEKTIFTPFYIF